MAQSGLRYTPGIRHTVLIRDAADRIAAAGSLEGDVIKCVAVAPEARGEGLTAAVLTALRRLALEEGRRRLFLYTKPAKLALVGGLGFGEVARGGAARLVDPLTRCPRGMRRGGDELQPHDQGAPVPHRAGRRPL